MSDYITDAERSLIGETLIDGLVNRYEDFYIQERARSTSDRHICRVFEMIDTRKGCTYKIELTEYDDSSDRIIGYHESNHTKTIINQEGNYQDVHQLYTIEITDDHARLSYDLMQAAMKKQYADGKKNAFLSWRKMNGK